MFYENQNSPIKIIFPLGHDKVALFPIQQSGRDPPGFSIIKIICHQFAVGIICSASQISGISMNPSSPDTVIFFQNCFRGTADTEFFAMGRDKGGCLQRLKRGLPVGTAFPPGGRKNDRLSRAYKKSCRLQWRMGFRFPHRRRSPRPHTALRTVYGL